MKIYTKAGDKGSTSLMKAQNVSKTDDRINLLGNIDELTSNIGLIKALETRENIKLELERVQKNLMKNMASIADQYNKNHYLPEEEITHLEEEIDGLENSFPRKKEFVLPGNCEKSARIDIVRTITRRTERSLIAVDNKYKVDPGAKKYINRLSDYFYMLARYTDYVEETIKHSSSGGNEQLLTPDEVVKAVIKELKDFSDKGFVKL